MGRPRTKYSDNPVAKNLYNILQKGDGYKKNIEKLENSGIGKSEVNSWLNGNRNPQYASIKKISTILNIPIDCLIKESTGLIPEQEIVIDLVKKTKNPQVLEAMKRVALIEIEGLILPQDNKNNGKD